jgi:transposase
MEVDILGIDLAKRVFQLHGADCRGHVLHRAKVTRSELLESVRQLRPRIIAMEACSSAHHWARQFQAIGVEVKLVSPHYVKPFVKTNKNDRNDAEAIVEAACRPSMNFVPVKSVEQQDIQAIHRTRELLVHQRTALINQVRGLLAERGITVNRSPAAFKKSVPDILEQAQGELTVRCQQPALCQKIAAIPGVGVMTATAIVVAVGVAKAFKNGRHLAAWIGLVPQQNSSGGKPLLLGISKRGDDYLRRLLIHGARSVLIRVTCRKDARSLWLQELIARRGYNRAPVALANKNARVIQSVLSGPESYRPSMVAA